MKLLITLAMIIFSTQALASTSEQLQTCLAPCSSRGDFPFWDYSVTGISNTHNINIRGVSKMPFGKLDLAFIGPDYELKVVGNLLGIASADELVIPITSISYHIKVFDKKTPADLYGQLRLRLQWTDKDIVLAEKFIELNPDDVQAREFDDIKITPLVFKAASGRTANLRLRLTNAAQLQCTWIAIPNGLYCDDELYKKLDHNW